MLGLVGLDLPVGLVVKASALQAADPGCDSHVRHGDVSGSSHTSDLNIGPPVAALQAPSIIGSALGLADPLSVYGDWMR